MKREREELPIQTIRKVLWDKLSIESKLSSGQTYFPAETSNAKYTSILQCDHCTII